jgi:hypothetical protein
MMSRGSAQKIEGIFRQLNDCLANRAGSRIDETNRAGIRINDLPS